MFAYGDGVFVGILPSGKGLVRSIDGGATWSSPGELPSPAVGLVHAQGRFLALGGGHVFTSIDGSKWTDHAAPTAVAGDLTYGHGTYLALAGENILRSTDGIAWTLSFANEGNPNPVASVAFAPKP
ncbi:MAG: hypothetical protein NVSMB47_02330 [Polyangiales bacterium]